jgi:hypothetical protein
LVSSIRRTRRAERPDWNRDGERADASALISAFAFGRPLNDGLTPDFGDSALREDADAERRHSKQLRRSKNGSESRMTVARAANQSNLD